MKENKNPFEIKVGMVLFKRQYHRHRGSEGDNAQIIKRTVTKVGNKYFYVADDDTTPISLENLQYNNATYSQCNFNLRLSEQEIKDEIALEKNYEKIYRFFNGKYSPNITLSQSEQILKIIFPDAHP